MISCRHRQTLTLSLLFLLLCSANVFGQQPQTKQPLAEKENPQLIGHRNINQHQINLYSLQKEIAAGREMAVEFERQTTFVDDTEIADYIKGLGRNLMNHSDAKLPIRIRVIRSDEVDALALPGGFLYLNLGLLKTVETESELAGVIAHLIAHVAARHSAEMSSKAELVGWGQGSPGAVQPVVFSEKQGAVQSHPQVGLNNAQIALPIGFLQFSRSVESEADLLGVQYLWAAGYNPNSLIKFLEKVEKLEQSGSGEGARMFRTHPPASERITKVKDLIARFPEREKTITNTEEFNRVKARWLQLK